MRKPLRIVLIASCLLAACSRASDGGSAAAIDVGQLRLELPSGWQQVPPSSQMRLAQFAIPGADGSAELAVFHFGVGQGGDVETNIARWIGQMEIPAGETPHRALLDASGLHITCVEVEGTLRPGQMGMGPSTPQPGSMLLGAVVEGEGGPWFFKATGPAATLGPQRDAFVAMLKTIRLRKE